MVELDFIMEPDGDIHAINYPTDDGWEIDIYLPKLKVRENTNIVKLAQKINSLYLLEYLCAEMQKYHGEFDEERYCKLGVTTCVIEQIIKNM